ncbi:hypothetical protein D3C87_157400 [compost metagenome]
MKKFYILAAALTLTTITVNAQENLIVNGNFENWTAENPVNFDELPVGTVTYNDLISKETTIVKSGNSVKQQSKEQNSTQYLEYGDLISVTPGSSYTISYWYLDNDNKARTRLWCTWLDANDDRLSDNLQTNVQLADYSTDGPNWVNKSITVTAPAGAVSIRYQIRAYNQNGVGGGYIYYDDLSFVENTPAGIDEHAIAGLKMYPNPISENILNITSDINGTKAITIYDVVGKQVINTTVNDGIVNISDLTTGIYIVKITEEGKTSTRKLVRK